MVDRTTSESLYQSSEIAAQIIDCLPDAIVIVDQQGLMVRANNKCNDVFGYRPEELIGQKLEVLLPERFRSSHVEHRQQYHNEPRTRQMGAGLDLFARRKDGSEIPVDIMLAPVTTRAGTVVTAVVRDVTERTTREQIVRQLMQQREDYVATLTHDLKTPILAANRAIQLMMDGDFGSVSDSQQEVLKTLLESNESMYKLVRTLLDVYRYDSGMKKLVLASHDMTQFIQNFLMDVKPLAQSKAISIEFKLPLEPVFVICDPDEIKRVFQNLVDNALKFTPHGGSVQVRVETSSERVVIAIVDTGRGIPEHERSQLFQRFWQAAPGARNYAGTGLGLYLCRKIVELHGGDIWCESAVGSGSTFYFTLTPQNGQAATISQDKSDLS